MIQKRWLDEKEKVQIDELVKSGLEAPLIAAIIEKSTNCFRNELKKKGVTGRTTGGLPVDSLSDEKVSTRMSQRSLG